MALPTDPKTPWPPKALKPLLADMDEADAWYSGDIDRLRNLYGGATSGSTGRDGFDNHGPATSGILGKVRFWERRAGDRTGSRTQLHIPLAADIASTSADLLFSEPPTFAIAGAADAGDNSTPAKVTQDRLDALVHEAALTNSLLESAEVASALGGVYVRAVWDDRDILPAPTLSVVHADAAAPEWKWGRLQAVTFWTVLVSESQKVWRHLERHEPGLILHGLYVGDRDTLGIRVDLRAHPDTGSLIDGDDRTYDEDAKELAVVLPGALSDRLTVRYIPNVRPNRRHRGSLHGRSDFDGCYPMMDALDETWSSWMRDLRLGVRRVVVSQDALTPKGRGRGATLDIDQELFTGLELEPTVDGKPLLEPIDFALRVEEHEATAMALIERIVSTAGYSPQSFGLHIEGRAESGTALRVREGKTLRTQGRKQRYWDPELAVLLETLLIVDREMYGTPVVPVRPQVGWGDALADDPRELAETVEMLSRARAASVRTRVQMVSPHLEGAELQDEVDRVMAEEGMTVADPAGFGA